MVHVCVPSAAGFVSLPLSLFPFPSLLVLCLAGAHALPAQVVRGVVRESESGAPLAGVLVSLDHAGEAASAGEAPRRITITRYARSLQTQSLRVLSEERAEQRGVTEQPFISIPAESLTVHGYRHEESDGSATFFAPDATVLLSDAFVREHCFSVAVGRGSRANLMGLAFTPVRDRDEPAGEFVAHDDRAYR